MAKIVSIALVFMLIATPCLALTEEEYIALLEEAKEIIVGYQVLLAEKDQTINALLEINTQQELIIKDLQRQAKPRWGIAIGAGLDINRSPNIIIMVTYSF